MYRTGELSTFGSSKDDAYWELIGRKALNRSRNICNAFALFFLENKFLLSAYTVFLLQVFFFLSFEIMSAPKLN